MRQTFPSRHAWVLQMVIPAHQEHDLHALAQAMHSFALDAHHPIALEIGKTATHQRCLLIRATDPTSLRHLESQLRIRYPHASFLPLSLEQDPLVVAPEEALSVVELSPAAPSHLPFLVVHKDHKYQEVPDPVLGILAALDTVPEPLKVVAQLAMVPAPSTWSRRFGRKTVEHPLEKERQDERERLWAMRQRSGGTGGLVLIGVVAAALVWVLFRQQRRDGFLAVLHDRWSSFSGEQITLVGGGIGLLLLGWTLFLIWCARRRQHSLYDMDLVAKHASRMAYHVRLRVMVIGPREQFLPVTPAQTLPPILAPWQPFMRGWGRLMFWWQRWQSRHLMRRQRESAFQAIVAAYRQFDLPLANSFQARVRRFPRLRRIQQQGAALPVWEKGIVTSPLLLTVDALASLWHPPSSANLPDLAWVEQQKMRTRFIPPMLAQETILHPPMGFSEHAGQRWPFALPPSCLDMHMLILGKSGEGKSTCLSHLAMAAMQQGGMMLIDPHGDLVDEIVGLVPPHRKEDVVLIDLSDSTYAIGMNPLDVMLGQGRDKAIADLTKTFSRIWATSWGSRMEIAFEYALRTLYEANLHLVQQDPLMARQQYTLLHLLSILTQESFCHSLLQHVPDVFIRRWWVQYFDPLSSQMQRDRIDPVLSKMAKFEGQIARRIIGQSQSTLDLRQCVREERILLVKLAKGEVGEDVARLLGATLLGLFQVALEQQSREPVAGRKRFRLLIDEFQFLNGVDWNALAELRKYGAAFYLATQSLEYIQQMDVSLLPLVLANVKQYITFHISAQDAEVIARELEGVEPVDLVNLASHHCYVKLTYAGQRLPPFSVQFDRPPLVNKAVCDEIRERCRQRFMRPVEQIEEELETNLKKITMQTMSTEVPVPSKYGVRREVDDRGYRPREQRTNTTRGRRAAEERQRRALSTQEKEEGDEA